MPERDARSVEEGAGKRCSECGGRCRKAMLGVWRKVPESDARSVEEGAGKRCSECGSDRVHVIAVYVPASIFMGELLSDTTALADCILSSF